MVESISSEILDSSDFCQWKSLGVIPAFSKAESFLECLTVWSRLDQWKSLAILPPNLLVVFPLTWLLYVNVNIL